MDKKIKKRKWTKKRISYIILASLFLLFIIYYVGFSNHSSKMSIDPQKVTFATVRKGAFQEYIVQSGEVLPSRTFFLDAVEGGNIVRVFKESGAMIKKGEPIIELTNANLSLSVLGQENSLNEQINRIRTTRLQLDQNYLSQKQELAQIENQLNILGPQYRRDSILFSKELISAQDFEKTKADYYYNLQRKEFTYESFKNDSASRVMQHKQLRLSEDGMLQNLSGVRKILDNLIVRAPIDGQLTTTQLREGQNIDKAERVGRVDVIGSYKVRVGIDELYLSRIDEGLEASTTFAGKQYRLKISYIYPQIEDGQFEVDMEFIDEIPSGIRSGLSLRLKIELGDLSQELLVPVGGFYNSTGGNWIFRVDGENDKAVRSNIRLGKKNSENYQVLQGLSEGDRVITSSYDSFGANQILVW